jgi:hypothetical protein
MAERNLHHLTGQNRESRVGKKVCKTPNRSAL